MNRLIDSNVVDPERNPRRRDSVGITAWLGVLTWIMAYNAGAIPDAEKRIAEILKASGAAAGLYDFARQLEIPAGLREIGMPESGIARAADLAMANPYWNPQPLERGAIRDLIADAWAGQRPTVG